MLDVKQKVENMENVLIDNFYGYTRNKDNDFAKSVLHDIHEEIKKFPVVNTPDYDFPSDKMFCLSHLEVLNRLYFSLLNGDYSWACNEVSTYFGRYPMEERRVRDAIIAVFEKFEI